MGTQLILLGTGSPACQPDAFQTASAVIVNDRAIVVDCGGGTVQRISQAVEKGVDSLYLGKLDTLILTHLHPDHTAGLADFIVSTWIRGRQAPLKIYGPAGTEEMVGHLIAAYKLGIAQHAGPDTPTKWPLLYEVHEYTDGDLIADENVRVTAFRVSHGNMETYGLTFVTEDKKIVFSADTIPHPAVIEHATGCDILVHEVYSERGLMANAERYPPVYFQTMHTSTLELAEIANKARPKLIVLQHEMALAPMTDEEFVAEISDHYDGAVVYGRDLDIFE